MAEGCRQLACDMEKAFCDDDDVCIQSRHAAGATATAVVGTEACCGGTFCVNAYVGYDFYMKEFKEPCRKAVAKTDGKPASLHSSTVRHRVANSELIPSDANFTIQRLLEIKRVVSPVCSMEVSNRSPAGTLRTFPSAMTSSAARLLIATSSRVSPIPSHRWMEWVQRCEPHT